jgi:hypothetical protein
MCTYSGGGFGNNILTIDMFLPEFKKIDANINFNVKISTRGNEYSATNDEGLILGSAGLRDI